MATQQGSGFVYTTDDSTEVTHSAHLWLRAGSVAHVQTRYTSIALDQRTRDVVALEGGAYEADGHIRFDDEPEALLAMLVFGANGGELDYYPDLQASTFVTLQIVNFGDVVPIEPDADRHGFGEWQVSVRVRRMDGDSIAELYT